jgi:azurin
MPIFAQSRNADGESVDKKVVLKPVGNQMKYATTKITAKAGSTMKVVFKNTADSSAMKHNFALLKKDASPNQIGPKAIQAGPDNGYIPKDEKGLIAYTEITPPGETSSTTFKVPDKPGTYTYICLYPGHYTQMQGKLIVKN